ncbi:MAG: hypothetical protein JNL38_32280 [Myxococcales bacterium]|nr:hypothetical protein [Myxococcales bacterium]
MRRALGAASAVVLALVACSGSEERPPPITHGSSGTPHAGAQADPAPPPLADSGGPGPTRDRDAGGAAAEAGVVLGCGCNALLSLGVTVTIPCGGELCSESLLVLYTCDFTGRLASQPVPRC